jgi:uncharacterized membrane protein
MGHGHSHRADSGADDRVVVGRPERVALLTALAAVAVATVVGLLWWWPEGDPAAELAEERGGAAAFTAPGVTFLEGEVVEIAEACPGGTADGSGCSTMTVDLADEGEVTVASVPPEVLESGLEPGDTVRLQRTPGIEGAEPTYSYWATDRDTTLVWMALLFVVVVVGIARWRGFFAILGLAFGGAVVWWFVLPALLGGAPGVGVALTGASAIMYVVLYTTHGFSMRTSAALAGTILGILVTAGIGVLAVADARLTGISDDTGSLLGAFGEGLDFQSLLGCALVIAGLGVLNDVTITQASAVWELRSVSPTATRRAIFNAAMRIGRDHIASTIYTIVFAYVGTALFVLMLLQIYAQPLAGLLSTEQLSEEIVLTLSTSIGLVLAVPITTALAAAIAAPSWADDDDLEPIPAADAT